MQILSKSLSKKHNIIEAFEVMKLFPLLQILFKPSQLSSSLTI